MLLVASASAAFAGPEEDVKATFAKFVAAQNAHDLKAVEGLLLDSPDFLWITRGAPLWGREEALKRFGMLYQGTWHLDPEGSFVKVILLNDSAAQLYAPVSFQIGAAGQAATTQRFMLNQVLVKTKEGWKVSSILPIPVPTG